MAMYIACTSFADCDVVCLYTQKPIYYGEGWGWAGEGLVEEFTDEAERRMITLFDLKENDCFELVRGERYAPRPQFPEHYLEDFPKEKGTDGVKKWRAEVEEEQRKYDEALAMGDVR